MVTDEFGAVRHAMTAKELDDLYKRLENFIADCTRSEVDANRDALKGAKHDTPKNEINKQISSNRRGKPRHKRAKK